jgi:hypothetical protein
MNTPLCRASDPITSFMAADRVKEFQVADHYAILSVLLNFGPGGADRIGRLCNRPGHAVNKRLNEMKKKGFIRLTGKLVRSDSGRMQREWESV